MDTANYLAALRQLEHFTNELANLSAHCRWELRETDCDHPTLFYRRRHRALTLKIRALDVTLTQETHS